MLIRFLEIIGAGRAARNLHIKMLCLQYPNGDNRPDPPNPPDTNFHYLRPGGTSLYLRPDGSHYHRPA